MRSIFVQARTVEWSRHSYRQALRDVLPRSTSCEEWFSLLHPTLLEGVHAGGRRFVVKKKKEKRERKKRKQNQRRKRKKKHQERGNITEIKERIKIIREK